MAHPTHRLPFRLDQFLGSRPHGDSIDGRVPDGSLPHCHLFFQETSAISDEGGPAPPVPLPWPVEIELALKKAELLAFVETSDRPRKYYVGRDLRRVFRLAGLARCTVRSVAFTRQAPLDPATRSFLEGYLEDLRRRTGLTSSPACESSSTGWPTLVRASTYSPVPTSA